MKTYSHIRPVSVVLFSFTLVFILGMGVLNQAENTNLHQTIYVNIDGIEHEVIVGESTEIMIGESKHTLSARLPTERIFRSELISFQYPVQLFYKQTDFGDSGVKVWQLSSNNALLMVQEYDNPIENTDLVSQLIINYESMDMTWSKSEIEFDFGNEHLVGQRLELNAMGTQLVQEVFTIMHSGRSISFILQHINDGESESIPVFKEFKTLLGSSLKLNELAKD